MPPSLSLDILQPAQTKLLPPAIREGALRRSALIQQLRTFVREKDLTLLSAPAGYGKTTLLSHFTAAAEICEIAWLTLDAGDDEPMRLLSALLAEHPDQVRDATDQLVDLLLNEVMDAPSPPLATVALVRDEMQAAQTHITSALEKAVPARTKIQLLGRARAKLLRQEWTATQRDLDRALQRARQADSRSAVHAVLAHLHVVFAALPDGIEYVEVCRLARDHLGDNPSLSRLAFVSQQAYVHLIRGDLDQSSEYCQEGADLLDPQELSSRCMYGPERRRAPLQSPPVTYIARSARHVAFVVIILARNVRTVGGNGY